MQQKFPQFASRSHVPAGFLIDSAGLKGTQVGQMQVSHKHAAFVINLGSGTTTDFLQLVAKVKSVVKSLYGVELQEEIIYIK